MVPNESRVRSLKHRKVTKVWAGILQPLQRVRDIISVRIIVSIHIYNRLNHGTERLVSNFLKMQSWQQINMLKSILLVHHSNVMKFLKMELSPFSLFDKFHDLIACPRFHVDE